jgi:hypothetical protein
MSTYDRFRITAEDLQGMTPRQARDIMARCFIDTHKQAFSRALLKMGKVPTTEELELNLDATVRRVFREAGGNFDAPDPRMLRQALERLTDKALVLGTPPEDVEHHREQMTKVFAALPR